MEPSYTVEEWEMTRQLKTFWSQGEDQSTHQFVWLGMLQEQVVDPHMLTVLQLGRLLYEYEFGGLVYCIQSIL